MSRALCSTCMESFESDSGSAAGVCPSCASKGPGTATATAVADPPPTSTASPEPSRLGPPMGFDEEYIIDVKSKVKAFHIGSEGPGSLNGKGTLIVNSNGMRLEVPKTVFKPHEGDISITWTTLRRLRCEKLATEGWFEADFGGIGNDLQIRIEVDAYHAGALGPVFAKLPPKARGETCQACGAIAMDGRCTRCGVSVASQNRMWGIASMIGGAVLLAIGGLFTWGSYEISDPGEEFTIFAGVLFAGFALFAVGLMKTISGRSHS